ncbi:helix-turn-helix transcriptional regulator [Ectopseudomonas khazarica]|uniref:helix-turn-helix transcriptional regulator n=1 Tax=Ectopseudomonas khazarica TaxID=2502979 RepID=UPI003B964665
MRDVRVTTAFQGTARLRKPMVAKQTEKELSLVSTPVTDIASAPAQVIRIASSARHRVRTLSIREDLLVLVRRGRKALIAPTGTLSVSKNEVAVLARGTQWDVLNDPADESCYEALALAFSDEPVRAVAAILPPVRDELSAARTMDLDGELSEVIERTALALEAATVSPLLQRHRVIELLLVLGERGVRLKPVEQISWAERIRRLIALRPEEDWRIERLAEVFHTSASTLRRRLAGSGFTLAGLVREVRLETALVLLQSTQRSINDIALHCGWESHSRFSAAFQARWGFAPSVMRQRLAQNGAHLERLA